MGKWASQTNPHTVSKRSDFIQYLTSRSFFDILHTTELEQVDYCWRVAFRAILDIHQGNLTARKLASKRWKKPPSKWVSAKDQWWTFPCPLCSHLFKMTDKNAHFANAKFTSPNGRNELRQMKNDAAPRQHARERTRGKRAVNRIEQKHMKVN